MGRLETDEGVDRRPSRTPIAMPKPPAASAAAVPLPNLETITADVASWGVPTVYVAGLDRAAWQRLRPDVVALRCRWLAVPQLDAHGSKTHVMLMTDRSFGLPGEEAIEG